MSGNSPFSIIIVITGFLLVASIVCGFAAPYLSVFANADAQVPKQPVYPNFPDLSIQGNFSSTYAFDESHIVADNGNTKFTAFQPDKAVEYQWLSLNPHFTIERYGTDSVVPWWYEEPVYYLDGSKATLTPQAIIDAGIDGEKAQFIVDGNSSKYGAFADFTPLTGYSTLNESWTTGHGFNLRMYGNSYADPDWITQAGAYLSWFGALIAYFLYFLGYMVLSAGYLFTLLGVAPAISGGIIILVAVAFFGSILMFIRGNSGGGSGK